MDAINRFVVRWGMLDVAMAWLAIASALALFVPQTWFGLAPLQANSKLLVTLALLVALAFFISRGIFAGASTAYEHWLTRQRLQKMTNMIDCLDYTERAVLREFIISRKSVLQLPTTEPAVRNLIENEVLIPANQVGRGKMKRASDALEAEPLGYVQDLMISIEARPLLTYRVLGLPVGRLSEEQVEQLKAGRPRFLRPEHQVDRTHSGRVFRIRTTQAGDDADTDTAA